MNTTTKSSEKPAAKMPARGLGRGLSALIGDAAPLPAAATQLASGPAPGGPEDIRTLPVSAIIAGAYQPRRHFDEESLSELADSVERHGIMQPIVVRAIAQGRYEIIAGERRYRAAKLAKLTQVPVIVRTLNNADALELALIENIQRADLNPLEEAAGYQRLMEEFGYTQEKLAPVIGKSRSHIANLLRLQKLPPRVKQQIDRGELTMGHARALLGADDPEALAAAIIREGLSVRQAEERARGGAGNDKAPAGSREPGRRSGGAGGSSAPVSAGAASEKNSDVAQLESMLAENLGLEVSINASSGQAGAVVIRYNNLKQLDDILRRLGGGV